MKAAARLEALNLQALVYTAYRDDVSARRAVRAIYALAPDHVPADDLPPSLLALFEELRPPPPAPVEPPPPPTPPTVHLQGGGNTVLLTGRDAARWSRGLGGELEAGAFWPDLDTSLSISFGVSDHLPRQLVDEGMVWLYGGITLKRHVHIGNFEVSGGLTVGAGRVSINGALQDDQYWGGLVLLPLTAKSPRWMGVGLYVRTAPGLFTTPDGGRLAGSWLLPFSAGLDYRL
ncbi:MAG: hypothetical protein ACE366_11250 [Bradymonadia bacterium]